MAMSGFKGASTGGGGIFGLQTSTAGASGSGAKKFLSGRPSLHDVLTVAPEWEPAFKNVHSKLQQQDDYIEKLRATLRTLRTANQDCKEALADRLDISRVNSYAQDALMDEIDDQQPVVRKLNRHVNSLTASCQRLVPASGTLMTATGSLVMVPQPDNVRFVEELKRRTHELQQRADVVLSTIESARRELTDNMNPNLETEVKNILSLLLSQYKQLKLRHLGLQEELKSLIQSYQNSTHQDVEQLLENHVQSLSGPILEHLLRVPQESPKTKGSKNGSNNFSSKNRLFTTALERI